jgi:Fe/S biogenesis protein NfuA
MAEENAMAQESAQSEKNVMPLLTITPDALAKVLEVRSGEDDPAGLVLWVEVDGEQNGAFTYLMEFRVSDELGDDVSVQHHDDLSVAVPAASVEKLRGATLELSGGGMVMQNPNRPEIASPVPQRDPNLPPPDLTGEIPQRVVQVLEEQINPAIASHGGYAELVAVESSIAYLRLSGGCQGCGMAAVTLSQGIEVAILDSVPEITEVIDVTDHASGTNPYYEAAKK